jgi:hypothetical protein
MLSLTNAFIPRSIVSNISSENADYFSSIEDACSQRPSALLNTSCQIWIVAMITVACSSVSVFSRSFTQVGLERARCCRNRWP